jgi:hypothetical protein
MIFEGKMSVKIQIDRWVKIKTSDICTCEFSGNGKVNVYYLANKVVN